MGDKNIISFFLQKNYIRNNFRRVKKDLHKLFSQRMWTHLCDTHTPILPKEKENRKNFR